MTNLPIYFMHYKQTLTWLLKDSLGGNSKTSMLATISPTDAAFSESMSTLRYVERAKLITTCAVINETSQDPAFVAALQRQIQQLKENLHVVTSKYQHCEKELRQQLEVLSVSSGMGGSLGSGKGGNSGEILALRTEVQRLNLVLEQKQKIITDYEVILLENEALLSGDEGTSGSLATNGTDRVKTLIMSYKKDRDLMNKHIEDLKARFRYVTAGVLVLYIYLIELGERDSFTTC